MLRQSRKEQVMKTVEPIRKKSDIDKLKNVLKQSSERNFILFTLGINCGLRISDILSLNVGDVHNRSHIEITEKKTGKYKKFPINRKLKPMLSKFLKGKEDNEPLFSTIFHTRMGRVMAYKIIKSACKKAGLDISVGTHTMRKTFGYHHYKKYKDVAMLQMIFNHSNPKVTLRYIGIEQEEIEKSYMNFYL